MNTRREAERRSEKGIANVGVYYNEAPPQDNQVPPLEEVTMGDQVPVAPPQMINGDIREAFLTLDQATTSQVSHPITSPKM